MEKPNISPNFTVDDIHKIREYNYEMTKNMSPEEYLEYYHSGASETLRRIEEIRKRKQPSA